MVSFPYYSHTTPVRIPKDMGMVWEAYHKGVPSLGVPEISLDDFIGFFPYQIRVLSFEFSRVGDLCGW